MASLAGPQPRLLALLSTFWLALVLPPVFLWPVSLALVVGMASVFLSLLSFLLRPWPTLHSILERRL